MTRYHSLDLPSESATIGDRSSNQLHVLTSLLMFERAPTRLYIMLIIIICRDSSNLKNSFEEILALPVSISSHSLLDIHL